MTTLRQYGDMVRSKYGSKLTDKNDLWVHNRSRELCLLYQQTNDRIYVNECFEINFAYMLHLLKNKKYRQGYSFEECISEYYIKLDNIMLAFDTELTIFFCKFLELRMRGHLSNIRKQLKEDLLIPLDEYYATLPQ